MKKAKQFMTSGVRACRPDDSLETAARLLWEGDCGALPVLSEGGRVRAMVTDRDICMAAYTQGRRLAEMPVALAMSKSLVACHPEDDVAKVADRMAERQVRRLPVVDDGGVLLGVVSLNDLVRAMPTDAGVANHTVRAIAGICAHPERTAAAPPAAKVPAPGGKRTAQAEGA